MATKRKKAPGGSRPLPPGRKKSAGLSIKFSTEERSTIDRAAEADHIKAVPWARSILMSAAEYRIQGITIGEAFAAAMKARGLLQK